MEGFSWKSYLIPPPSHWFLLPQFFKKYMCPFSEKSLLLLIFSYNLLSKYWEQRKCPLANFWKGSFWPRGLWPQLRLEFTEVQSSKPNLKKISISLMFPCSCKKRTCSVLQTWYFLTQVGLKSNACLLALGQIDNFLQWWLQYRCFRYVSHTWHFSDRVLFHINCFSLFQKENHWNDGRIFLEE